MNLILLKPDEVSNGTVRLSDRRFVHIRDVLKSVPGDTLRVGVLGGTRHTAILSHIDSSSCSLTLVAGPPPLPRAGIDILLALPRPHCFKRLLPQITALGIGRLYVVSASKVEKDYWGSRYLLPEIYQPLIEEGLEQSGDTIPPEIIITRRLKPLLEDVIAPRYADSCKLLAHPGKNVARVSDPRKKTTR
ncbi:MAG: RsmE family RNA methyltransferase, partial [Kiritimatiellaeota bacterium]|nr:RsmE family RNA methyltransferase [Kiritimatiellota bacterium]